jgi:ribosome maturation factor RimP
VYRGYIGKNVTLRTRGYHGEGLTVTGKLADLIESSFIIETTSGPQVIPLNMVAPGSFRVDLTALKEEGKSK